MRLLIDVSLSPQWVEELQRGGVDAVHWTSVGNPRAKDREIIEWAREDGCIVFTHDLDFGAILALTRASGPSVVQVRAQDVFPSAIGAVVLEVLAAHRDALEKGAIVSVDETTSRVRILPIQRRPVERGDATDDASRPR
jgi:predicted nuclease of predicted toxin-antitoxin system